MGVCESKTNLPEHISQHSISKLSESGTRKRQTSKLRSANHNDLIDKAKSVIDLANAKIESLSEKCLQANELNASLCRELNELREKQFSCDEVNRSYAEELDVQRESMMKCKAKMESLSSELEGINDERKVNAAQYAKNILSIADTLYKVHGDTVSKLKCNKMSKKFVVFIDKINHLFYYDQNGPKYIKIRDISTTNAAIQKEMNSKQNCWFLVIGERRSALFVAESRETRDKWSAFISKSLGKDAAFGKAQSPINIITITPPCDAKNHLDPHSACHESVVQLHNADFDTNGLKFTYPEKVKHCTIVNNGHTVQVNIPSSAKCKLSIYDKEFELKQFHFHTPSEHTIDSRTYEMEMHLVHLNQANEICVLGFIFTTAQKYHKPKLQLTKSRAHLQLVAVDRERAIKEQQDEESDDLETDDDWEDDDGNAEIGNEFLNQFWDELPPQKTEEEILLRRPLSFDYLFETASKSLRKNVKTNEIEIDMDIFEYTGSLTTPPYTEGVQWLLSKTTHFINPKQLTQLSACWNNENNARPVQKYCGRQVSLRSKSSLRVV
eukprot:280488_1